MFISCVLLSREHTQPLGASVVVVVVVVVVSV